MPTQPTTPGIFNDRNETAAQIANHGNRILEEAWDLYEKVPDKAPWPGGENPFKASPVQEIGVLQEEPVEAVQESAEPVVENIEPIEEPVVEVAPVEEPTPAEDIVDPIDEVEETATGPVKKS